MDCLETMEKIGLYIMIFHFGFVSGALSRFPSPSYAKMRPLLGAVEITTGIQAISGLFVFGFAEPFLSQQRGAFVGFSESFRQKVY